MKEKGKFVTLIALIFIVLSMLFFTVYYTVEQKGSKALGVIGEQEEVNDIVVVKKKIGKNVNLIDDFLKGVEKDEAVNLVLDDNNNKTVVKYIPASKAEKDIELNEDAKKYGYYKLLYKSGKYEIYETTHYVVKLTSKDEKVSLVVHSYLGDKEDKVLCEYDREISTDYSRKYWIKFIDYKDIEDENKVEKVADIPKASSSEIDYSVFTLGGKVEIGFDKDFIDSLTLEEALESGRLDLEELIEEAKDDSTHSLCDIVNYNDGGSQEFCYPTYTLLKYNTLAGKKDVYFGHKGIISGFAKYRPNN